MGQYYRPLVIYPDEKMVTLHSFDFDNMQKLMEHSWIGNNFVNAVYTLIHNNPCRVAWFGDYTKEEAEEFNKKLHEGESISKFYNSVWGNRVIKPTSPSEFKEYNLEIFLDIDTKGTYLINHTQKIYLDIGEYIAANKFTAGKNQWVWCINPLPLLTACANGAGGSYYGINMKDVGTWAFDEIEYSDRIPETYEKITYRFREHNGG